jgi:hypothetical protein
MEWKKFKRDSRESTLVIQTIELVKNYGKIKRAELNKKEWKKEKATKNKELRTIQNYKNTLVQYNQEPIKASITSKGNGTEVRKNVSKHSKSGTKWQESTANDKKANRIVMPF